MLLYGLLHLAGYALSMDEIRRFRQMGSLTPGHPECDRTPGVDMSTGPLGQGIATAVGMALAERMLAAEFNRDGMNIVDHRTWVFLGDGCLMEGVSQEACSLAGTLGLGKLVALYDDNSISIDGRGVVREPDVYKRQGREGAMISSTLLPAARVAIFLPPSAGAFSTRTASSAAPGQEAGSSPFMRRANSAASSGQASA